MRSYIGVSGITRREDALALLGVLPQNGPDLMVGILATARTVRGCTGTHPLRYPATEDIDSIFPRHVQALNLVHYATDDTDTLGAQLVALTRRLDSAVLHGYQINVPWPDPKELETHFMACGRWHMVLQIGPQAFGEIGDDPWEAARRISRYGGLIDRVLFDASAGEGVPIDVGRLRPFLIETLLRMPELGLGVAGRLGPSTLPRVAPLFLEFPDLSIDAETLVRDPLTDVYDPLAAQRYVEDALSLLF